MAVQTFTILNKANHAAGTYTLPVTAMPANMTSARVYIDSTQGGVIQYTNPATHIGIYWSTSFDGGQTYAEDGATTDGGYVNRQGAAADPSFEVALAYQDAQQVWHYPDHAQGRVVVSGGTVRFGVFADVTTG